MGKYKRSLPEDIDITTPGVNDDPEATLNEERK